MVGGHETKRAGSWTPSPPATTLPAAPVLQGKTDIDPDLVARTDRATSGGIAEGQILRDRYRLLERIGAGGMGEVWKAEHVVIGRPVAIKVLGTQASDPQRAEALMREARAVAALRHPNIVGITDFGYTAGGAPYLVMELLQGRTLKQVIASEGRFSWPRARSVLLQLTDALMHVHRKGIIHRDLKPDNVFMLGEAGREVCKIIDFGIAKLTVLDADAKEFTRTDMVFGTPAFMGPEQAQGEPVDHRTDVYALGCVAYQMLTGRHPFPGTSPTEVLYKQLFEHPERMSTVTPEADVTPEIEAVVMMAMRKTPALRFSDMAEMRAAIEAVGTGAPCLVVPDEPLPTPSPRAATRFATAVAATPPPAGPPRHLTPQPRSAERARQPTPQPRLSRGEPARPGRAFSILSAAVILVGLAAAAGAGYLAVIMTRPAATDETDKTETLHVVPTTSGTLHEATSVDTAFEPAPPAAGEQDSAVDTPLQPDELPDVAPVAAPDRPRSSRRRPADEPEPRKELPSKPDPIAPAKPEPEKKPKARRRPPPARKPVQDGDLMDPDWGPAAD
jgi:serine/threonine-protein kinase